MSNLSSLMEQLSQLSEDELTAIIDNAANNPGESIESVKAMLGKKGLALSDEQLLEAVFQLSESDSGELSQEELSSISGGGLKRATVFSNRLQRVLTGFKTRGKSMIRYRGDMDDAMDGVRGKSMIRYRGEMRGKSMIRYRGEM